MKLMVVFLICMGIICDSFSQSSTSELFYIKVGSYGDCSTSKGMTIYELVENGLDSLVYKFTTNFEVSKRIARKRVFELIEIATVLEIDSTVYELRPPPDIILALEVVESGKVVYRICLMERCRTAIFFNGKWCHTDGEFWKAFKKIIPRNNIECFLPFEQNPELTPRNGLP
jgi:hypothetical protein